jgi:hypothetical protein
MDGRQSLHLSFQLYHIIYPMNPLNQRDRNQAFGKFMGVYSISIFIPLVAVWSFFYTPNHMVAEDNEKLRGSLAEQEKLLTRMSNLKKLVVSIRDADQSFINETNELTKANLLEQIGERENSFKSLLYETKKDSASYTSPVNRNLSATMAHSFNVFLTYRGMITPLRQMVQQKGNCCADVEKLNLNLKASQERIDLLSTLNATLTTSSARNASSGGGGGGSSNTAEKDREIARLKAQMQKYKDDLTQYKRQLDQKSADRITETSTPTNSNALVDALKVQLDFERALHEELRGDISKQTAVNRRDSYRRALTAFETIAKNTPIDDFRNKAQKRITEINNKLRELSW